MKKIYLVASAVLTITALASCQQEEKYGLDSPEKGEVGFYLRGAKVTKASEGPTVKDGITIPITVENGEEFYLEESIINLDEMSFAGPETKGTPVYTNNFVALSGSKFNATVTKENGTVVESDGEFEYDGSKFYRRKYANTLWDNAPLYFYMWMPGALNAAVGVNDLDFDKGSISFTYDASKLETASDMQDLVFTSRKFNDNKGTANNSYSYDEKNGADILFHHALTGVKFSTANYISGKAEGTKTYIKEVRFKGLADGGYCVITPRQEKNTGYTDNQTEDYSSAEVSVWSKLTYKGETTRNPDDPTEFYQTYTPANHKENVYEGSTLLNPTDEPSFFANDASWTDGTMKTTDWNINNKDGELTFWFIPQTLTDDVELEITFYIQAGIA